MTQIQTLATILLIGVIIIGLALELQRRTRQLIDANSRCSELRAGAEAILREVTGQPAGVLSITSDEAYDPGQTVVTYHDPMAAAGQYIYRVGVPHTTGRAIARGVEKIEVTT